MGPESLLQREAMVSTSPTRSGHREVTTDLELGSARGIMGRGAACWKGHERVGRKQETENNGNRESPGLAEGLLMGPRG